jgi:16S rRNA processing protein RimM
VAAEDLSDDPERFVSGARFSVKGSAGERQEVILEHAWHHKGRLILKFAGVDSINAAEALRNCEVQIPREELGPAPEGQHYQEDLIGCRIVDADSGREIGIVEDVLEPGGPLLLQVAAGEREVLVPFVRSICVEIARERGEIRVRLPEGLEDLNP